MKNKTPKTEPALHPRLASLNSRHRKQLVLLLLVCLTVAGVLYFQQTSTHKKHSSNIQSDKSQPAKPPQFQPPTGQYEKIIYEADQRVIKSDYAGSINLLESAMSTATDKAQLYTLESKVGFNYKALGDWQNAIKWFEQAQATGQPGANGLYLDIAEAAERANDKPKAIAAYKKALEILKNNPSPVAKKTVDMYQAKIKNLGGS